MARDPVIKLADAVDGHGKEAIWPFTKKKNTTPTSSGPVKPYQRQRLTDGPRVAPTTSISQSQPKPVKPKPAPAPAKPAPPIQLTKPVEQPAEPPAAPASPAPGPATPEPGPASVVTMPSAVDQPEQPPTPPAAPEQPPVATQAPQPSIPATKPDPQLQGAEESVDVDMSEIDRPEAPPVSQQTPPPLPPRDDQPTHDQRVRQQIDDATNRPNNKTKPFKREPPYTEEGKAEAEERKKNQSSDPATAYSKAIQGKGELPSVEKLRSDSFAYLQELEGKQKGKGGDEKDKNKMLKLDSPTMRETHNTFDQWAGDVNRKTLERLLKNYDKKKKMPLSGPQALGEIVKFLEEVKYDQLNRGLATGIFDKSDEHNESVIGPDGKPLTRGTDSNGRPLMDVRAPGQVNPGDLTKMPGYVKPQTMAEGLAGKPPKKPGQKAPVPVEDLKWNKSGPTNWQSPLPGNAGTMSIVQRPNGTFEVAHLGSKGGVMSVGRFNTFEEASAQAAQVAEKKTVKTRHQVSAPQSAGPGAPPPAARPADLPTPEAFIKQNNNSVETAIAAAQRIQGSKAWDSSHEAKWQSLIDELRQMQGKQPTQNVSMEQATPTPPAPVAAPPPAPAGKAPLPKKQRETPAVAPQPEAAPQPTAEEPATPAAPKETPKEQEAVATGDGGIIADTFMSESDNDPNAAIAEINEALKVLKEEDPQANAENISNLTSALNIIKTKHSDKITPAPKPAAPAAPTPATPAAPAGKAPLPKKTRETPVATPPPPPGAKPRGLTVRKKKDIQDGQPVAPVAPVTTPAAPDVPEPEAAPTEQVEDGTKPAHQYYTDYYLKNSGGDPAKALASAQGELKDLEAGLADVGGDADARDKITEEIKNLTQAIEQMSANQPTAAEVGMDQATAPAPAEVGMEQAVPPAAPAAEAPATPAQQWTPDPSYSDQDQLTKSLEFLHNKHGGDPKKAIAEMTKSLADSEKKLSRYSPDSMSPKMFELQTDVQLFRAILKSLSGGTPKGAVKIAEMILQRRATTSIPWYRRANV